MNKLFRENPTITFGLGLPLLLILVFLLISWVPGLLVAPPQYDVIYSTGYGSHRSTLQISVVGKKAQVRYQPSTYYHQADRLWRYNSKTGAVQEITIILPSGVADKSVASQEPTKPVLIKVPDLEALTLDSSSVAPDGYEFKIGSNNRPRNFFGNLFYSSRYYNEGVLKKSGRRIALPNAAGRYYGNNAHFVGWVVSQ